MNSDHYNETVTATAAAPEWLHTPDPIDAYQLVWVDWGKGGPVPGQDITLTRDEFIALKRRLAVLRGLEPIR
jgi:hypothetical protein